MPSARTPSVAPDFGSLLWDSKPPPEELAQLDAQCFTQPWDAATYRVWLSDSHTRCWIARDVECAEAVGWILCQQVDREAEVLRLGVSLALRGRGWGHRVLQGALAMLHQQGVGHVFLEVRAGNAAALALYRKSDFQETGLRRGYYADPPDDAVVMARELTAPA